MEIVEEGVSSYMLIDNLYILLLKVFRKKGMCNFPQCDMYREIPM